MNQGPVAAINDAPGPICLAPFVQLLLQPTGRVGPCCYHFGYSLGNAKDASLMEIWNSAPIRKLRRELLSGDVRICKSRIHNLSCHKTFERFRSLNGQWEEVQPVPPRRLDLRLNGQCNLACIMCDVWQQPNGTYEQTSFWTEGPREIFPFLKEIELLGGEPFVQQDTFRLIEEVLSVNRQCLWSFVTNGHYPRHKKILSALARLRLQQLQVSLDSLEPATYAAIRQNGDVRLPLQTIEVFREFLRSGDESRRGCLLAVSMCVVQQNWREIPAFLAFCAERGLKPDLQFAHYDPSGTASLLHLCPVGRREVVERSFAAVQACDLPLVRQCLTPLIRN